MRHAPHSRTRAPARWSRALPRAAVLALLWWAIAEGQPEAFAFGVPVILLAVLASLVLHPARTPRWRAAGLVRFIVYFVTQSVVGGVDVARRALHPQLPLEPAVIELHLRLPPGPTRVFMVDCLSLLPGTLGAELRSGMVRVHVLDVRQPVIANLRRLEERIADMFDLELARPEPEGAR
jgi:multicomponent Na+:H+ antiporter subunit E